MKKIIKIIAIISVILIVLFVGTAYVFVKLKGKELLVAQLEQMLDKRVSIGDVRFMPPKAIEVIDLDIEGIGSAGYIYISPRLIPLMKGDIILDRVKIVKPKINWQLGKPPAKKTDHSVLADVEIDKALA